MCGIVGYTSRHETSQRPQDILVQGLARLEYRGYDSAGIAVLGPETSGIALAKRAGKLRYLRDLLESRNLPPAQCGIGHTRWATHGEPSDINAHPHLSANAKVALIHNGIIENYASLRDELIAAGITPVSQTDTEVVAHLLGSLVAETGDLAAAMRGLRRRLRGTFSLLAIAADEPGTVVAARRNSPLVIGLGADEFFLASDVAAFVGETSEVLDVGQDWVVRVRPTGIDLWDDSDSVVEAGPHTRTIDLDLAAIQKGGYASFMEKEIHEQAGAVRQTLAGRLEPVSGRIELPELPWSRAELGSLDRLVVVACGTASYAGAVASYVLERWSGLPVSVELAHEFRYRDPVLNPRTLVIVVSQSGETLDTIMALRHANSAGARTLAIVNVQGSAIAREAQAVVYTHAGPEIAVASTKAFTAQLTVLYTLALVLADQRGGLEPAAVAQLAGELAKLPELLEQGLCGVDPVAELAAELREVSSALFLGRQGNAPIATEAALKLKELTYIHAEGFAAGELKHGPIALIDSGQLVVVVLPSPQARNELHAKVVSNIQEVKARGAFVVAVAHRGDSESLELADRVLWVPDVVEDFAPFLTIIPLQVFACKLASEKGLDVDQPRNLAKSVTVE